MINLHGFEERLVALSTSHVTNADADLLAEDVGELHVRIFPGIVVPYEEYGWILWFSKDIGSDKNLREMTAAGFSAAFIRLVTTLAEAGVQRLLLDRDAQQHPDLPSFDW